ncbi:MAG: membrane protein insertase YidC [Ignavibacteriales bacterium]|nr:membrane protein insertase YidC [Ignavibacteriales bacterium]
MDRQATLGFVLIFMILMAWMYLNSPTPPVPTEPQTVLSDTVAAPKEPTVEPPKATDLPSQDRFGRYFSARAQGKEQLITIETDLYKATITSKGGLIKEWELKKFKSWDGNPVQVVDYEAKGDLGVRFMSADGRLIETRSLYFEARASGRQIALEGNEERELRLVLPASNGGEMVKILRFRNGSYDIGLELVFSRLSDVVANFKYELAWESGLRYAERNSIDESAFSAAHAFAAGEHIEIDAGSVGQTVKQEHQGGVDWVAMNTKYFLLALIPGSVNTSAVYLQGERFAAPDNGAVERYGMILEMPFRGGLEERSDFKLFLGPADYNVLSSYDVGLERVIYLGWDFLVRPISVYLMLPVFTFLRSIIPNWGIVLIIFAIIIKVVLHPLTKTSMKSMKKMQGLQPMMEEIRAKYKDDPQKMNQQIMNLYREYGVNPAGGCLPLLLQFPILIALYNVFRAAIELRQAGFFWWIDDLSVPDKLFTLPFTIPLFGIQEVSGLALLMGITTFIQQKMTVKDPRQKAMVWMMPVMMTLLFNGFPSGLNLYYFVFNLLSIGQQMFINKQHDGEPLRKPEPKKARRGGVFGKLGDIPRINKKT